MTDFNIETRVHEIKLRRAQIAAELATMKHEWIARGVNTDFARRTGLEAEAAALAVESLQISDKVCEAKRLRRIAQNASLLSELQRLLAERGLEGLVDEAAARSRAALELLDATP